MDVIIAALQHHIDAVIGAAVGSIMGIPGWIALRQRPKPSGKISVGATYAGIGVMAPALKRDGIQFSITNGGNRVFQLNSIGVYYGAGIKGPGALLMPVSFSLGKFPCDIDSGKTCTFFAPFDELATQGDEFPKFNWNKVCGFSFNGGGKSWCFPSKQAKLALLAIKNAPNLGANIPKSKTNASIND